MNVLFADTNTFRRLGVQTIVKSINPQISFETVTSKWRLLSLLNEKFYTHIIMSTSFTKRTLTNIVPEIKRRNVEINVLLISEANEKIFYHSFSTSNADGILNTEDSIEYYQHGLSTFFQSGSFIPETFKRKNETKLIRFRNRLIKSRCKLSKNELIVIDNLLNGCRICDIAEKLSISRSTVSTYKNRAFTKLGIRSIPEFISLLHISKNIA